MTLSAAEGSTPRASAGLGQPHPSAPIADGAAAAKASPASPASAGALGQPGALLAAAPDAQPAFAAAAAAAAAVADAPALREPDFRLSPATQMIALRALSSEYTQTMGEITARVVDQVKAAKNRQADDYIKKVEDMARKIRKAMGSWLNKLPGWVVKAASVVAVGLLAGMAGTAIVASGGVAAAPLSLLATTAALSLITAFSLAQAAGGIASDLLGKDNPVSFLALERSHLLPTGLGQALDALFKGDLPGITVGIATLAGASPQEQMIVGAVFTAVTAVVMGAVLMKFAPSAALKDNQIFKYLQVGGNLNQVLMGSATAAQAGVSANMTDRQAAATVADAEQQKSRITLEHLTQTLCDAIAGFAKLPENELQMTQAVTQVLRSEQQTASDLVAQHA